MVFIFYKSELNLYKSIVIGEIIMRKFSVALAFVTVFFLVFPASPSIATANPSRSSVIYASGDNANSLGTWIYGFWKNGTWVPLSTLSPMYNSRVFSLAVLGSDVYTGGFSCDSSGVSVPGYWKNGTWISLPALSKTNYSEYPPLQSNRTQKTSGVQTREIRRSFSLLI